MAQGNGSRGPHILMVMLGAPGHSSPFIQLIYHLRHHKNVTVTVISGGPSLVHLSKLHERGDFYDVDLRIESVFGPPPLYPQDPKFPARAATASAQWQIEFEGVKKRLIQEKGSARAPTAIISDLFVWWTKDTADELGIPWYTVSTTASWMTLSGFVSPLLRTRDLHPVLSGQKYEKLDMPGLFGYVYDLPAETLEWPEFYANITHHSLRATGLLFNSSLELEGAAGSVQTVIELVEQRKKSDPGKPLENTKVFPIGPMAQIPGYGELVKLGEQEEALKWLDTQEKGSVLYIAFGSLGNVVMEVVPQLALGFEESGVPFLWVLKVPPGKTVEDILPEGFQARVQGRGFIETGWAPQSSVLLHPATGGFLSHAGWNSTLESLCAGVPMLTWPLSADQPMNARFVTDFHKVGLPVGEGPSEDYSTTVTKAGISKAVKRLMVSEEGKEIRKNSLRVKELLHQTVSEGGSTYVALRNFISELLTV
ncbi:hypothetical protein R1sor_017334 [Riccia sorocarpa]|uniref:Glycosyltransferase n=1 Tax=Riccia sorocarpa TaxID=122646 RepID=A0ABD3IAK7_9MARC